MLCSANPLARDISSIMFKSISQKYLCTVLVWSFNEIINRILGKGSSILIFSLNCQTTVFYTFFKFIFLNIDCMMLIIHLNLHGKSQKVQVAKIFWKSCSPTFCSKRNMIWLLRAFLYAKFNHYMCKQKQLPNNSNSPCLLYLLICWVNCRLLSILPAEQLSVLLLKF